VGALPRALAKTMMRFLRRPGDLSPVGMLANLTSLVPAGLFDNAPLERYLAHVLSTGGRTNDFRALDPVLRVVTMHLDSAEVAVFGAPGRDHVPISTAIQASTALPGLYCPVQIDGQAYIDGVARRTVHASVALDAGADLLFCINPIVPVNVQVERQMDRIERRSLISYGLPAVLSQTFRALVDSRKTVGFQKYGHTHPNADIVLIEPAYEDTRLFFSNVFSFSNREAVCEHAYAATRLHLRRRAAALAPILARHDLRLNTDALADENRTLFGPIRDEPLARSRTDVFQHTNHVLARLDRVLAKLA
jgi:predicted acylesterase/phospholipase RssA